MTTPQFREHPKRQQLLIEPHARPFERLSSPMRISHLALLSGEAAFKAERAALMELCAAFKVEPIGFYENHFSQDFGDFRLRYERHTEFSTYTFFTYGLVDDPFQKTALATAQYDKLFTLPGEMLVASHFSIEPCEPLTPPQPLIHQDRAKAVFGDYVVGAGVAECAEAYTDFLVRDDQFVRYLVLDRGLMAAQLGRLVQQLLEIETYRTMALLALPVARGIAPKLTAAEAELTRIAGHMVEDISDATNAKAHRDLLDQLTEVAVEIERLSTLSAYRFGAAKAYHGIVQQRIKKLREQRIGGLRTFSDFMERRMLPAMATCHSVAERLESVSVRTSRSSQLLRTEIDVTLEEQNRDLLLSMNRRAKLQFRLQETIEGVSVFAITYYAVGLFSYLIKSLKAGGVSINADIATGAAIPLVAILVWYGLRRARRLLDINIKDTEDMT